MELRRPKNCPRCGSSKFLGILHGRPTSEGMDAVDRGEYILGGGFFLPSQPDWKCTTCGYAWFDVDDPVGIRRDKAFNDLANDPPSEDTDEPT